MSEQKPVAIVGIGTIMPDALDAPSFWNNIQKGHYSITNVPADRWRADLYFDSDPKAVDKSYSKIGAWVKNFEFNPMKLHIPIPPTVLSQMDLTQQWGIAASHQALSDYGYPQRTLDPERVAVIIGNANAGERHYRSTMRILLPEYLEAMTNNPSFRNLPQAVQQELLDGLAANIQAKIPEITEDTMSGELSNIIAGRIANVFNFSGPNFVTDAACASSLSALSAAMQGLNAYQFDCALTGGVDRNMGPESYVKFCKIGALSANGTRPYAEGADGFVMGEGAGMFVLKRLEDAERDGDHIYAVVIAIGSSSDGKGKGITAPNPLGQQRAIERAWKSAGVSPSSAGLIEGHGTSTRVGDVVEVNSLNAIFGPLGIETGSIALGSVKSNIGHLKSAAGAAGLAKAAFALDQKILPPSANFHKPNPAIDFEHMPFYVNTQSKPWPKPVAEIRRAAVSSFGFGGTNFHVVLEEYLPGYHQERTPIFNIPMEISAAPVIAQPVQQESAVSVTPSEVSAFVLSAVSEKTGYPVEMLDLDLDLEADLGVDTVKQAELFANMREHFGVARREDLRLSEYNTLAKVIGFFQENTAQPTAAAAAVSSQKSEASQPSPAVAQNDAESIQAYIVEQVAEKTGYPAEMLDLDLDLEADLGVDTVKQAELFATIREHYGIPRREDLRLSEYNTLSKVMQFVNENLASATPASPLAQATSAAATLAAQPQIISEPTVTANPGTTVTSLEEISAYIIRQVAEKTGYPAEMLDLELDLEADLGVDTVKQAELFATIREHYGVPKREDLRLSDYNTLAKVIAFFAENANQPANSTETATLDQSSENEQQQPVQTEPVQAAPTHMRGLLFLSADTLPELKSELESALARAKAGTLPPTRLPEQAQLAKPERIAIDYGNDEELIKRAEKALPIFDNPSANMWQALTAQGVYYGNGKPGKVAFLFPGQGSQYVNMLVELRAIEPVVDQVFLEADQVMTPLLGKPLTEFIYADGDEASLKAAEQKLKDTTITQPAVLTANIALLRLLQKYGFDADMVIGHSLGEYAALVAAGVLTFAEALEIVSARGREMVKVAMEDNGCMAAVSAPLAEVERILDTIDGYVVLANINSPLQSVIAGSTKAVEQAIAAFMAVNYQAVKIPVSHAFHTKIVEPASIPLRKVIARMNIQSPRIPIAANVTGEWYPTDREEILDMLAKQVASPVQFVKGVQTLYDNGARIFVEVGPKRVMNALSNDIFKDVEGVTLLATNHPRKGALPTFNEALCALYAAGLPAAQHTQHVQPVALSSASIAVDPQMVPSNGKQVISGSVVISGAGLGLPGRDHDVFAEDNIQRILRGEVQIESFPQTTRQHMLEKRVTRLVKHEAGALMVDIDNLDETVKLAGQSGHFDPAEDFGIPADRVESTDISTQLAIAAGIEALRDAGIPLVMNYRTTSKGTLLPNRWMLPEALQDETGIIFGSAFPGLERMSQETKRYYTFQSLQDQKTQLLEILAQFNGSDSNIKTSLQEKIAHIDQQLESNDYHFNRHFVFQVLAMGHSQFAEHIGARGPNTSVNAACATTTHAVAIAEDWIRAGRCRRVIVVAGDDVTSGELVNWIGTGLMASGAATTEGDVRMAAIPFDRRRNGMIMGMGAAALVVESEDAVQERGMRAICEVLSSQIANSAFHGTRLDVPHVGSVMERVIRQAEDRFGIARDEIAARTVFVSHETYTPARGGSAAAEIHALRSTFGSLANQVIIANTKGFTGHTMGVGIEDVIAVKSLQFGIVPPIAHYDLDFQPDPELGDLNLSKGGQYPVEFSLRLGAGFGSQIAMTLYRKINAVGERIQPEKYQKWLAAVSGYNEPQLEVVQHNLRIKHEGAPTHQPAASQWQFGYGPQRFAEHINEPAPAAHTPAVSQQPQNAKVIHEPEVAAVSLATPVVTTAPLPVSVAEVSHAAPQVNSENSEITSVLVNMVSEKTGYPAEMLDLDLDLEADLGIDTVKQAELFAEIRTHYNIPRREDLRLSDYNTLAKVINFVADGLAAIQSEQEASKANAVSQTVAVEEPRSDEPQPAAEIIRRVPIAVLRPRLDLCTPTGIQINQDSRVIVFSDQQKIAPALQKKLKNLNAQVLLIKSDSSAEIEQSIKSFAEDAPIDGIYFLATLAEEKPLQEMTGSDWQAALNSRFYNLISALRLLPQLSFLIVATRFDGLQGLSQAGSTSAMGGAASGLAKAMQRERPGLFVKVIDFDSLEKPTLVATRLLDETLLDPAVVEIGWEGEQRFTVVLSEQPLQPDNLKPLRSGSVFVVSGGTGGITAPILLDLSQATQGQFYLLARSPLPQADDPNLQLVTSDEQQLKTNLVRDLSQNGQKATPAVVNQHIAALQRAAALMKTMETMRANGSQVTYMVCDVSSEEDVQQTVAKILTGLKKKKVDVLIHAAGVEKSRKLESKSDQEIQQIMDVKASGLFYLLKAFQQAGKLPAAVLSFGSVAGRFGNAGQVDYSAANDLLAHLTSAMRRAFPQIQVSTLDWGAWSEVGMASRGHIPELMRRAGIDMINPSQASCLVRKELEGGLSGEVILAGHLGQLEMQDDPSGGLDVAKANEALTTGNPTHVMLSRATGINLAEGILLEVELDPTQEPFLRDHALNGIPLLPGIMGIEGFSVAAQHIASALGAAKGGFRVEELADIAFLTPFKFYRDEARTITWKAQVVREASGLVAHVSLESYVNRRNNRVDHMQHFRGNVHLVPADQPMQSCDGIAPHWNGAYTVQAADIYKLYFHGPSFQVLEGVQKAGDTVLGKLNKQIPSLTGNDQKMLSVPVLVELCFQTAGIWEAGTSGALSLPQSIGTLRIFENKVNGVAIFAEVKPFNHSNGDLYFDARVIDSQGRVYLEMENYRTAQLPYGVDQAILAPISALNK
ncbi:MAG: hypothetical protein BGO78_08965 [Chloroflexi bacterium 44-23]|nr:MAG: hypothetical protein BGO78_08965 [Chloroflexi bacterium 44-23]